MITFAQLPLGSYERSIHWLAKNDGGLTKDSTVVCLVADTYGKEHEHVIFNVEQAKRNRPLT